MTCEWQARGLKQFLVLPASQGQRGGQKVSTTVTRPDTPVGPSLRSPPSPNTTPSACEQDRSASVYSCISERMTEKWEVVALLSIFLFHFFFFFFFFSFLLSSFKEACPSMSSTVSCRPPSPFWPYTSATENPLPSIGARHSFILHFPDTCSVRRQWRPAPTKRDAQVPTCRISKRLACTCKLVVLLGLSQGSLAANQIWRRFRCGTVGSTRFRGKGHVLFYVRSL